MSSTPAEQPVRIQRKARRGGKPAAPLQLLCALLATLLLATQALARTETITWNHPSPPLPTGFGVYQGSSAGVYGPALEIGLPTPDGSGVYTYDLTVPDNDTVYVVMTAYGNGLESSYSNEQIRAPAAPPPNQAPNGTIDNPSGPVTIATGQSISFLSTGSDPDGNLPLSYQWSFGGSGIAPSSAEDPGSLTFASAGSFTVTLTVTDDLGLADPTPDSVTVTVQEPPPPGSGADVSATAGVSYTQYQVTSPPSSDDAVYLTGGVAAGDYDDDGAVDVYVTRLDAPDILFRNNGDGTFSDVTAAAGLDLALASNGAGWADVDNDGDLDLYVTTLGATANGFALFINDGSGNFSEEAFLRGAAVAGPDAHYGFSVAVGDYDLDGWLDLHTTEWRPDALNPGGALTNARLLRNLGAASPGFFEDVTNVSGVALDGVPIGVPGVSGTFALTSRFAHMDADDWPDLLVTSDFGSSRLFWNNGNGTFTDGTTAAGVGTDDNGAGSAVGDYDGDGDLDWFVTGIYDPSDPCAAPSAGCVWEATGNRLYRNEGNRSFSDQTDTAGVRDGYWGAAAAFFELDNDGDLDLIMTNGANVPHLPPGEAAAYTRFIADPLRLWENDGAGGMTEVSAIHGWTDTGAGRGLATLDYDNDGDLDVFIANQAGGPVLFRNDVAAGNSWLRVVTEGRDSNRNGVGTVVSVWTDGVAPPQVREISAGSHYLGQSEMTAHFGLGAGTSTLQRVSVYWPKTQRRNEFFDVPRNTVLVATEPPGPISGAGGGVTPTGGGDESSGGPQCGLLGIEPFLILPLARRLGRSRRRSR